MATELPTATTVGREEEQQRLSRKSLPEGGARGGAPRRNRVQRHDTTMTRKAVTDMMSTAGTAMMRLLRWKTRALETKRSFTQRTYTTDGLSKTLYNCGLGDLTDGLLNVNEIIFNDTDKTRRQTRSGHLEPVVLSFLTDPRVRTADAVAMIVVLLSMFIFPLTFMWGGSWANPELVPFGHALLVLDFLTDVVYAVYCFTKLRVTFMHPVRRTEVSDWRLIRRRWFRSPTYWLMWFSCTAHLWFVCGASLLLNNIKVVRMLHVAYPPDSFWRHTDRSWARLVQPLVILVASAHWIACGFTFFGGYRVAFLESCDQYVTYLGGPRDTWTVSCGVSLYFMSFVEALYMLTGSLDNPLGDGGPREGSFAALLIVSFFGPVGCVVVSMIISAIVREQTMAHALQMRHEDNKAMMSRAMTMLSIPDVLQQRVLSLHYYQKMGHDAEAFAELFDKKHLSPPLKNALLVYNYMPLVESSQHKKGYFFGKDPNYIIEVLRVLKDSVFLPGDYVARKGEVAQEMMFVNRGKLSVLVAVDEADETSKMRVSQANDIKTLAKGDNFGEMALVRDSVRSAWVRANTYALLASLARANMLPIWVHYPEEKETLENAVFKTAQDDKKRQAKARWKKCGNGWEAVTEIKSRMSERDSLEQAGDMEDSDSLNGHGGLRSMTTTTFARDSSRLPDFSMNEMSFEVVDALRSLELRVAALTQQQVILEDLVKNSAVARASIPVPQSPRPADGGSSSKAASPGADGAMRRAAKRAVVVSHLRGSVHEEPLAPFEAPVTPEGASSGAPHAQVARASPQNSPRGGASTAPVAEGGASGEGAQREEERNGSVDLASQEDRRRRRERRHREARSAGELRSRVPESDSKEPDNQDFSASTPAPPGWDVPFKPAPRRTSAAIGSPSTSSSFRESPEQGLPPAPDGRRQSTLSRVDALDGRC